MIKEKDLKDQTKAEEIEIKGVRNPKTHQRIIKSRRSIYLIASTQSGQPVRLVNMKQSWNI